jgi:hypothetical protein
MKTKIPNFQNDATLNKIYNVAQTEDQVDTKTKIPNFQNDATLRLALYSIINCTDDIMEQLNDTRVWTILTILAI